jgi:Fe-Mn family superoxide dismutase
MKTDKLFDGIDVSAIIKESIKKDIPSKLVDESYVAEPKSYKQVSELVSQKTKEAHTALYQDYVGALNKVSAELDTADKGSADSKHSQFRSLKLDETYNHNSVLLHELYFANCFDPHSEITMDSLPYIKLQEICGTFDDWQAEFIACAMACGQGWVVTGFNTYLQRYVTTMISNHSQDVMLGLYPLIVLDMHEHAYARDYLTDKKSYIIAMMRQINWEIVEERFKRAEALKQVLK